MPAFELLPKVWSDAKQRNTRPWSEFKNRRATIAELRNWYVDSNDNIEYGIAVIGGKVSGGLEIVDLDNWDVVEPWSKLVQKMAPGLLKRLVRVKSPRPGLHVYYRCEEFGGSQKLARIPDPTQDGKKPKTVIELKGAAGYCLAPPSPSLCHPTNRPYLYMDDLDLTKIPLISSGEREILLNSARQLDVWGQHNQRSYTSKRLAAPTGEYDRPGDNFNATADWGDILIPHGWSWVCETESGSYQWRRPGKSCGVSATTGFAGSDLLYTFSTNADPFEPEVWYTKFHAYTLLNHNGDFRAAARELAKRGYRSLRSRPDSLSRYSEIALRSFKTRPE